MSEQYEAIGATDQTANVYIRNDTSKKAVIQLYHTNDHFGAHSKGFFAEPGEEVGPLPVRFRTGGLSFREKDYWSVRLTTFDGEQREVYANEGGTPISKWKEYQLQSKDAGKAIHFSANESHFHIDLPSGGGSVDMIHSHTLSGTGHVFVLMLENHSFDNIFGRSGLPGITVASETDSNFYEGERFHVTSGAPSSMSSDPAHEFMDGIEQLTGVRQYEGGTYPPVNNEGFVQNYATSTSEGPTPEPDRVGDVMRCFDTKQQLPVIYTLASEFAICDHWHSSMPGPTWPNRFFVHGASSNNLDDSPTTKMIKGWQLDGFAYSNGSIYQAMKANNKTWRIYTDWENQYTDTPDAGSILGRIPQVLSLKGVWPTDINWMSHFGSDLNDAPYDHIYTFIEPNYGDVGSGSSTFKGGSSQHPMDNTYGGENMIRDVYQSIRNSPLWYNSMLVIAYDEHGGFYDSAKPAAVVAPGDGASADLNKHGFNFDQLGVRVPAVVISPWIKKGKVIKEIMEHSAILKTVEKVCGLGSLTERDKWSRSLTEDLDTEMQTPRTDCPSELPVPVRVSSFLSAVTQGSVSLSTKPLPESGNLIGTLGALLKAEKDLDRGAGLLLGSSEDSKNLDTYGDVENYAKQLIERISLKQQAAYAEYLRATRPQPETPNLEKKE